MKSCKHTRLLPCAMAVWKRQGKSSAIQYLLNNSSLKRFFIRTRHAFSNHTLLTHLQIAHFQSLSDEMIKNLCLLIGYNRLIKFFEWSAKTRHDVLDIVSYRRHDTIFLLESSANWMWWDDIYRLVKKQFQALSQEICVQFFFYDWFLCLSSAQRENSSMWPMWRENTIVSMLVPLGAFANHTSRGRCRKITNWRWF